MMFALGIRYLMSRVVATQWQLREEPEWPPHPDRVFMALVAGHGETGLAAAEAEALRWLEALPPPQLAVSRAAGFREAVTAFVPVNDTADPVLKGKPLNPMGSLPIGRIRQPRQFPAVVPVDPTFHLLWPDVSPAGEHLPALEQLCGKVTYLGHSSTPAQMWLEDSPPPATLVPVEGRAGHRLRVFGPGRYDDLRRRFAQGQRPLPALWQGYDEPGAPRPAEEAHSTFDETLIVLRQVDGRRLALESTLLVSQALRNTLMSRSGLTPAPEWLGGHQPSGEPVRRDHLAIVPLGFVGRPHADGHLLGLGLAVPRDLPQDTVGQLMSLLEVEPGYALVQLHLGRLGDCCLELDDRPETTRPFTLRPSTWSGPAQAWATVTPMVLDQFPRRKLSIEEVVATACERAGLPRPAQVRATPAPAFTGVPHSRSFPAPPHRPGRPPRPLTHAIVFFDQLVHGPVLLGAGRYQGYGLCRPFEEGQA